MRRFLVIVLVLISFSSGYGQDQQTFFTGFFPELSLTKKLQNSNKLNLKIENQHVMFDNRIGDKLQFDHYRTDVMGFYDWKLTASTSAAIGLFHRFQDGADGNRIIQQYAFLNRLRSFQIGHRLRTDQTFTVGQEVEWRLRYRVASEIPLNGANLDPGETYFLISNEPIFSLKGGAFNLENRLIFTLGKLYPKNQKLEYSIDYRTDGFFNNRFRTRLWPKIGYYYNF